MDVSHVLMWSIDVFCQLGVLSFVYNWKDSVCLQAIYKKRRRCGYHIHKAQGKVYTVPV